MEQSRGRSASSCCELNAVRTPGHTESIRLYWSNCCGRRNSAAMQQSPRLRGVGWVRDVVHGLGLILGIPWHRSRRGI